jgi:hypothetical protein
MAIPNYANMDTADNADDYEDTTYVYAPIFILEPVNSKD